MDCSLPGSSVHEILQARISEWVAFPSPGDLPNPGIKPRSPALQADSLPAEPQGKPWKIFFNSDSNVGDQKFTLRDVNCVLRNPKRVLKQVKDIQVFFFFKISLVETFSIDFTG